MSVTLKGKLGADVKVFPRFWLARYGRMVTPSRASDRNPFACDWTGNRLFATGDWLYVSVWIHRPTIIYPHRAIRTRHHSRSCYSLNWLLLLAAEALVGAPRALIWTSRSLPH